MANKFGKKIYLIRYNGLVFIIKLWLVTLSMLIKFHFAMSFHGNFKKGA